jgi:hypothetical protein
MDRTGGHQQYTKEGSLMLYPIDEARGAIIESSAYLLHNVRAEPCVLERLIYGERRGVGRLRPHERAVATAHRALIRELNEAGYEWAIEGELDGFNPGILFEEVAHRLLDYPAA